MKTLVIAGAIGKDAILRRTQDGDPVLGFSVGVDDGYGQNKSTIWFDCSVFGKRGQSLEPHLKKGTRVTVAGELGTREHNGKTYLTCRANDVAIQGGGERSEQRQEKASECNSFSSIPYDMSDEVPF